MDSTKKGTTPEDTTRTSTTDTITNPTGATNATDTAGNGTGGSGNNNGGPPHGDLTEPPPTDPQPPKKQGTLFDLDAIRLRQDFAAGAPVKKALLTVPVRKPGKQEFFRIHSADTHRLQVGLLILEDTGEVYVVTPDVADQLGSDVAIRCLVLTINRQGVVSLWPLAMPDEDGRLHEWGRSALEAANLAKTAWVRLRSNRSLGAYEVELAAANLADPVWPEMAFSEIVSVAFRGRVIDSVDHPVVRALKGAM